MNMDVSRLDSHASLRGKQWFEALSSKLNLLGGYAASVLVAEGKWQEQPVQLIAVIPDQNNLFPRARHGEVGLIEGWNLAKAVDDVIRQDQDKTQKRAIICIVDVPSQAYGRREELFGIHQALAGAVDSYARARLAKHPVISLLVGKSMSGAFLAHGYQANRIFALKDQGVMVHAMGKESAARVTLRSVDELERLAASIPPMAYDIASYASLGLLTQLLDVRNADSPQLDDIQAVRQVLIEAINAVQQQGDTGLSHRLNAVNRQASKQVRERLREQWQF